MRSTTEIEADDAGDLVVRARTDRDAMGRLYDRYYPAVHRYCRRRLFDRTAAEDVTSEVFLQVAKSMRGFTGSTGDDFRCWVFRIATNAVNAHQRRRARRGALLACAMRLGWGSRSGEPAPGATVEGEMTGDDWTEVEAALRTLGPREQTAVNLRYMEGLSFAQIAKIMDEREGTLRVVVSRALGRLREALQRPPAGGGARS